ncbi:ribokinase [Sedimentitalea arenosa]|uniref:Ribokinase n=1 Tax=Sedimentitalea arenosa TaxID=2798803 RepID=A0A8J7JAG8_9RHOB|nr:ribokinase [Arenibacterium arenosum]MBJ6372218.1 ribokinase [Arenibacterium arenosum]
MGKVVVMGVFVADAAFRAERTPRMGETVLGRGFVLGPGGKGSNQAVAAARMGAEVHFLTRLGQDAFAEMARGVWKQAGVAAHATPDPDSYTGAAFIYLDDATGENAIIVSPGAAERISTADAEAHADLIAGADVFMTQLEHPLAASAAALRIARDAGVVTILNPAPAADLPAEVLSLCDYVTPNETETEALTGIAVSAIDDADRACQRLCDLGVGTPIITLGERGAYLHGHGLVPAVQAGAVVDTTGAGDAFNGGFAAALTRGCDALAAVRVGCATAGLSVTRAGAAASMPDLAEVEALLN